MSLEPDMENAFRDNVSPWQPVTVSMKGDKKFFFIPDLVVTLENWAILLQMRIAPQTLLYIHMC